ncbi:MAG: hypothetical protein IT353_19920 [Gemmatimonadaceae bacterium]|nr:hypothetical protein [Gemmatimonadaceae bacterium]
MFRPLSPSRSPARRAALPFWAARAALVVAPLVAVAAAPSPHDDAAERRGRTQPATLDVGSFTISVNGERVGREQFSIQRTATADGATLELRAESAIGDRRSAVRLEADSNGSPLRYTVETRAGATITLRLGGQRVRGRFTTLARSSTGEAAREYLLLPGVHVLEEEGLLQYALLVRFPALAVGDSIEVPVLTPIANRQGVVWVSRQSDIDTVIVAGSRRSATRWQVRLPDGGVRLVWADADGRLLRIRIPAKTLEALRDDVPR